MKIELNEISVSELFKNYQDNQEIRDIEKR